MSEEIKCLGVLAPENFEKSLNYRGQENWLEIHLEPEINQTICSDGKTFTSTSPDLWRIIIEYLVNNSKLQGVYFSNQHCLLLDRQTRFLYVGEQLIVQRYLQQSNCLDLFVAFHEDKDTLPQTSLTESPKTIKSNRPQHRINDLIVQVSKGAVVSAISISLIFQR